MYIFNQDGDAFVNSNFVKSFWVDDVSSIYADGEIIAKYNNRDDAIKELNSIFHQLEAEATSYQVR